MSRIIVNYRTDDGDNMELETYQPIQAKCPILPYFDFPLTHAMYCPTSPKTHLTHSASFHAHPPVPGNTPISHGFETHISRTRTPISHGLETHISRTRTPISH